MMTSNLSVISPLHFQLAIVEGLRPVARDAPIV